MLRKVIHTLTLFYRSILIMTSVWLIIEWIYFKNTGNYIIYYRNLTNTAGDFLEYIWMIDVIFESKWSMIAYYFTNYFVDGILWISPILLSLDAVDALEVKSKRAICIIEWMFTIILFYLVKMNK